MPLPEWLVPMAATLTAERFVDPAWSFERKLDGIRVLAYKDGGDVHLWSRNRLQLTDRYPAIARGVAVLPVTDAVLDGEATGGWFGGGRPEYHVFDVLWLAGQRLTSLPLHARRERLGTLPFAPPLRLVTALATGDEPPWDRACREGWEGVIAKRLDAPYEHRRSRHWLKMKCEASQELVVGGFTDPQGARVGLGALLVGYFEAEDFVFAGKVGTGFDTALLHDLRAKLEQLRLTVPPFTRATGLPRLRAHWVRPEIVVQVAFMEWTPYGKLRHPRLVGLRPDKQPREVVRESPA